MSLYGAVSRRVAQVAEAHTDDFFAIMRERSASMLARLRASTNRFLDVFIDHRWDSPLLHRLSVLVGFARCEDLNFPPWFKFGVSTSAYQIEGGWREIGKSLSNWDTFTHNNPAATDDGSNGDVACDSYHLWRRDVQMIKEMGLDFYRFSISWSRLLPTGFPDYINPDGIRYYNNLIDELLKNGIQPFVTLMHYDIPQRLQDLGGWANPLMANWFASYAQICYALFGDRVKLWMTIDEPMAFCDVAYSTGAYAPGIIDDRGKDYCTKTALLAHAKAWRIYDEKYKPQYQGKVCMGNNYFWFKGLTDDDNSSAEFIRQDNIGRFSHPIYSKKGGWPPMLLAKHDNITEKRFTYPISKLPVLSEEEIQLIKGTYDFIAINHYTTLLVVQKKVPKRRNMDGRLVKNAIDSKAKSIIDLDTKPEWRYANSTVLTNYPPGLRELINWLRSQYGEAEIMITGNGYASTVRQLNDDGRIDYIRGFLKEILTIINEDKVNITGYAAWTLMDSFGWTLGYTTRFGLYEVDFSSPNRTRTPRKSAHYYAKVVAAGSLDVKTENLYNDTKAIH